MQVFVAVGEQESFVAASRRLDLSPAAVTRAIGGLETRLGVRLLRRTTRNVRLTEAGHRYLADSRHILSSIAAANQVAADLNSAPKGHLSIAAPESFGRLFIMPCIVDFLKSYPEVEVSAHFADRMVNLVEDGIDIEVRIGHLPDSRLRALRVGQVRRVLCASPEYLARHGVPQQPLDLQRHAIIDAAGKATAARLKPRLSVTSEAAALDAVLGGLGICRLASYEIAAGLAQGRLQIILADYEEAPWPVHILHREGSFGSSKVRHLIDLMAATLRAHPAMNGDG